MMVSTAGSSPVEGPAGAVFSVRARPRAVGDIAHHTAPDLYGFSVHAFLIRKYLV
ncbi:MAG TPA: hypothetical protein VFH23_06765 [Jiangellaceae bacterium]|nr:hypothetical protein [Jiangellaceae bacterium]